MTMLTYCHIQGKVRFPTYWHALRVKRALDIKRYHIGGNIYRCKHCHQWHLTHYSDPIPPMVQAYKPPSKKVLRSRRRANREIQLYDNPVVTPGEPLHDQMTMKQIRPLQPIADKQRLIRQVSDACGELKMFTGGAVNCALFMLHEALVQLEQCDTYRHQAKVLLNRTRQDWQQYEHDLLHPGDGLRFFHLDDMQDEYRKRYGDITDAEYFEFWQGMGSEMYMQCHPDIIALCYKYERYLTRIGHRNAKAYATAMTADALLQLSCIVWDIITLQNQSAMPALSPSFRQLAQPLSPQRIADTFHQAIEVMFLSHSPELTALECADIKSSTDSISATWSDPITYTNIQESNIKSYASDVFRTKGEVRKLLQLNSDKREEIQQEILQQRIKEFTK